MGLIIMLAKSLGGLECVCKYGETREKITNEQEIRSVNNTAVLSRSNRSRISSNIISKKDSVTPFIYLRDYRFDFPKYYVGNPHPLITNLST